MIEKAICVWYVLLSSSCRCAFFAMSIFEVRKSKFAVFQYVNKRVCPLPGNCFVAHGDVSRRMICWKKTFTNSLVEAIASENVREKSVIASKQKKNNDMCTKIEIYVQPRHSELSGLTPRIQPSAGLRVVCSVCKTR